MHSCPVRVRPRKKAQREENKKGEARTWKPRASRSPQLLSRSEIEEVVISHAELGERLAWSFLKRWHVSMPTEEVTSIIGVALCEAAIRFDKSKGVAFKTFFFYHLRGTLIKEIIRLVEERKATEILPQPSGPGKSKSDFSLVDVWPALLIDNRTPESMYEQKKLAEICWGACAKLDPLAREVILRSFVFDQPLNAIAQELGYCRCHISRVKREALATLSRFIKGRLRDFPVQQVGEGSSRKFPVTLENGRPSLRGYKGGRGRRKTAPRQISQAPGNLVGTSSAV